MNSTSSASLSANVASEIVAPPTTSGSLKSGAGVPSSNIVEKVRVMGSDRRSVIGSELDMPFRAVEGGNQGGPRTFDDGEAEAELTKHVLNAIGIGMLGAEAEERDASDCRRRGVRRDAPVDEVRHQPVPEHDARIGVAPGQDDAVGAFAAAGNDHPQIHALRERAGRERL